MVITQTRWKTESEGINYILGPHQVDVPLGMSTRVLNSQASHDALSIKFIPEMMLGKFLSNPKNRVNRMG
jgi:hypothetical protein